MDFGAILWGICQFLGGFEGSFWYNFWSILWDKLLYFMDAIAIDLDTFNGVDTFQDCFNTANSMIKVACEF